MTFGESVWTNPTTAVPPERSSPNALEKADGDAAVGPRAIKLERTAHDIRAGNAPRPALCAVLACHGRRDLTLASLSAFEVSARRAGLSPRAVLVDDGSPDGTADAVKASFGWVVVIEHRAPPLYWCRAMHVALQHAAGFGYSHYLLLNDDTILEPEAISSLLACEAELSAGRGAPVIVAGTTNDGVSGKPSYGGERRASRWRKTTFRRVLPGDTPQQVETFDGNIVLIPRNALRIVGSLDPVFEHAMGDLDLGLRAGSMGIAVWLAPGIHGACRPNSVAGTFRDRTLSLPTRWRLILHQKGLPWRSWLHFTRRHAGIAWPAFFVWPYVRLIIDGLSVDGLQVLGRRRRT